jgi:hypothetical protein
MGPEELEKAVREVAESEGTCLQGAIRDILTDLRVVADTLGLDFDMAIEGSLEVYHLEQE